MSEPTDGIYSVYLSGKVGQGFAMIVLRKGQVVGADSMGATFDGRYADTDENNLLITLTTTSPPNMPMIQGGVTGPQGELNDISFHIPRDFESRQFIRIETKHGPVNAKLVKLRGLDD